MKKKKKDSLLSNFTTELFASAVFSLMFFVFASRFTSENFVMAPLEFAYILGAGYVVAVFVSSYKFKAHVLPFFTLVEAVLTKSFRMVLVRIPAQILGTVLALTIFYYLQDQILVKGTVANLTSFKRFDLGNANLVLLIQAALILTLSYLYYIIKKIFALTRFTGAILIGLLLTTIFAVSGQIQGIYVVHPWGYAAYSLFSNVLLADEPKPIAWQMVVSNILLYTLVPLLVKIRSTEMLKPRNELNQYDI